MAPKPLLKAFSIFFSILSLFMGAIDAVHAGGPVWQEIVAPGPSPRGEFGFAFDNARSVAVLLGGSNNLSFTGVNRETWEWNGASWTMVNDSGPSQRCDQAMAFDSLRDVVVSFGGYNGSYLGDTWEWDGSSWTNRMVSGPTARADSFMAFDSVRGVMVLFGGQNSLGSILQDTWEWNGTAWSQRATTGPPARWIQRMAYDSIRGMTVMFGGAGSTTVRGDTWEWDGNAWTQRNPATSPSARYGHAMAFDVDRGVTMLYGGQTGFGFGVGVVGDTWQWDGENWTQISQTGPTPRSFVKLVYDSQRRRSVLFGGYNGSQFLADTWELFASPPIPAITSAGLLLADILVCVAAWWILSRRS